MNERCLFKKKKIEDGMKKKFNIVINNIVEMESSFVLVKRREKMRNPPRASTR